MVRVFTRDIGRYKKGEMRDYPKNVWGSLAKSVKSPLDKITREVKEIVDRSLGGNNDQAA